MSEDEEIKAIVFFKQHMIECIRYPDTNEVRMDFDNFIELLHDYSKSVKGEFIQSISDHKTISRVRNSVSDAEVRRVYKSK
tara:strand:+ start:2398 stop:2640 length:243 start_codon:yes stop_codon:yes gene_type:complete